MKSIIRTLVILVAISLLAGTAVAQTVSTAERFGETEPRFDPTQIVFKPGVGKIGLTLSVSGPEGYRLTQDYEPGVSPIFSVGGLVDGLYSYEVRIALAATPGESGGSKEGRTELPARASAPRQQDKRQQEAIVQSGHFRIEAGSLVLKDVVERGSETPVSELELTGQTGFPDKHTCNVGDTYIDGSLCVGIDCVCGGGGFGFDTIVLKENNLRIFFHDTSTSASFPSNDWRIIVNDSSNGGASYFGIDDATAGRRPFTLEAGAPEHSLYVDDRGDVGLGTSTPAVDLHVKDGNTPTLRLEQDGSSGFSPQTWDVAGNETNFFIRDVTTGSKLPFRIRPGAPTSALDIQGDGDVGMGTSSPISALHIVRGGVLSFGLENTTATHGEGTGVSWFTNVNASGEYTFSRITPAGGQGRMAMDIDGNLQIDGSITTGGGTCGGGCDLVFQSGYDLESIEEHAAAMWNNQHLPAVGPTVEYEPFNLTEKTGRILNELEKAHIYIEQLHERLSKLEMLLQEKGIDW